jgi:regulator of protease activity HflC (stomatin/prohibitin superfamily)
LDRENANKRRKQEGEAKVLELQNTMKRATAETDASNKIQAAKAWAEAHMIEAEAMANATKMKAEAAAEAVRIQALVDSQISDDFARSLATNRVEVERTKAYGSNTVFAPMEALNSSGMLGLGVARGANTAFTGSQ